MIFCVSISMSSEVSSLLTKMLPLPSATANSGLPPEGQRANHRAVGGVDGGRVLTATVEGEHALGNGVVGNGVGIGVGLYGADGLQGLEIEDGGGVRPATADEAATQVGGDGDAVDAWRVGDVAFDGVGVGVHDDDMGAVGDVDAAGVAVNREIVPAVIAGDGNGLDDVIAGGARGGDPSEGSDQGTAARASRPAITRGVECLRTCVFSFSVRIWRKRRLPYAGIS